METKHLAKKEVVIMNKVFISILLGAFLAGCSSQPVSNKNHTTQTAVKPAIQINNVHVTKNDGNELDLTVTADNMTNKAIFIRSSEFALCNNSTTLSPSSSSKVPSQIPANSKTDITLDFTIKDQLTGTISPKLGFQPSGNQPEQFQSLGNIKIPVPEAKKVSEPKTASNSNTNHVSDAAPHNYQADIEQDAAVIKSKATISVDGVQWEPIIEAHPDAEVPDGFGGMLYAWNVIVDGNGDGSAVQIYFFDNNRYLGKDTADYHMPSNVHAGSTGSIVATYEHYLANDANCCPSGQPFTVTFHWNGSRLNPDSVATLEAAVNDQFK